MISGSSSVYAQQRDGGGERWQREGFSHEDRTRSIDARLAARLASLKECLRLTPEQAKNWPAYESALQALASLPRANGSGARRATLPNRCNGCGQRAEALGVMGSALSRLADAQGPLYNSLDEDQRRDLRRLSQMLGDQSDMCRPLARQRVIHDRACRRGRDDDGDRRGWRGRDDDGDRRGWRGRATMTTIAAVGVAGTT